MDAGLQQPLSVNEAGDRGSFAGLEHEWNELAQACGDELFYRHEFVRVWIDNFASGQRLRVLLVREPSGRLVGALPLLERREVLYGVPLRQLIATANAHSCRFDLLARAPGPVSHALLEYLRADDRWDALRLVDVPEAGAGWALLSAAREQGFPSGSWSSLDSPYIELPASYEELSARQHPKFKANCRRRRKKLEGLGKVEFEKVTGGPMLDAALEEGFWLEQSGWKGSNGTAMAQARDTHGFYVELARTAKHYGALSLSFLRVDGRAVAFHFALEHGGRYLLLKPGYDEAISECSPGQLLMENVVADCIARGLRELDFLGPDMVWKRDWTDRSRRHGWIYLFRDSALGRALCGAKFRWAPRVRQWARKWRRS